MKNDKITHSVPQVATVSTAVYNTSRESRMGRMLMDLGKLTAEDVERILRLQQEQGIYFGEAAQRLKLISEADVNQALARQFDYPYLQPGQGNYPVELVAAYQPFSRQVETLRAVRSQLMLRWFSTGHKGLVVMSINSKEGASLFAANLAVVFSQLGEHTLLIDANLRRPQQQEIFHLKSSRQGLSDILAGRASIDAVAKVDSFVDLSVLPAGTLPPNPQELVSRPAFTELGKSLAESFDVILVDVPAFSMGADALEVAARFGGVLLVVHKHQTNLTDIYTAKEQLESVGVAIVGSILVDF